MPQDPSAALSNLEMLSEATSDEVALLSSLMTLEAVPAGFELSRQGDKGDRFWVVMAGTLEVTMSTGKADRRIAVAAQGAILGELSLLRDAPRSATIRALEDCLLVSGGPDALEALIDIESARQRIQAMASTRLAEDCRLVPGRHPIGLGEDRPHSRVVVEDVRDETVNAGLRCGDADSAEHHRPEATTLVTVGGGERDLCLAAHSGTNVACCRHPLAGCRVNRHPGEVVHEVDVDQVVDQLLRRRCRTEEPAPERFR